MESIENHFRGSYYKPRHLSTNFAPVRQRDFYQAVPTISGAFGSCSAAVMSNLAGTYLTSRERREEFVLHLYNGYHNRKTIYFLPTSHQFTNARSAWDSSILKLMLDLGAVKVYEAPNNQPNHIDSNMMQLHVLNCGTDDFRARCKNFIGHIRRKDLYGYETVTAVPRFLIEKFGLEEVEDKEGKRRRTAPKVSPVFVKEEAPRAVKVSLRRDSAGRFVKKGA